MDPAFWLLIALRGTESRASPASEPSAYKDSNSWGFPDQPSSRPRLRIQFCRLACRSEASTVGTASPAFMCRMMRKTGASQGEGLLRSRRTLILRKLETAAWWFRQAILV